MKKRIIAAFLAVVLALALTGCEAIGNVVDLVGGFFGGEANENGTVKCTVISENASSRNMPNLNAEEAAHIENGDTVNAYEFVFSDSLIWASTDRGFILLEYLQIGDTEISGVLPAEVIGAVAKRDGPGDDDINAEVWEPGEIIYVSLMEQVEENYWLITNEGKWINRGNVDFPGDIVLRESDGFIVYFPDDDGAVAGKPGGNITVIIPGGDEEVTDKPIVPESSKEEQKPESSKDEGQKPVINTAIVGRWQVYSESDFLANGNPSSQFEYIFNADGTYECGGSEGMYFYEMGGWYGASGGWGDSGTYSFDGSTLTMYVEYSHSEDGSTEVNETVVLNASISGNTLYMGDTVLGKGNSVNDCVRRTVQNYAGVNLDPGAIGSWADGNGNPLVINVNGTFSDGYGSGYLVGCSNKNSIIFYYTSGSGERPTGFLYAVETGYPTADSLQLITYFSGNYTMYTRA